MILMYLRKSRSDDTSLSVEEVLAKHEAILQEYCVKTYGAPLEESYIYREVVSGETIADRPEMNNLLSKITNEDVDGVLVVEPQRLSRGDLVDCGTIIRVFKYSNTKIITPQKCFDLTDKYDEKFLTMTLQQGNDYLEYIKTIMERGRIQAIKSGQYIGTVAPYGYDKVVIDGKKTLKPNSNAAIVELIFSLSLKGNAPFKIARELDKRGIPSSSPQWSATSVRHILSNITYTGKVKYGERQTKQTVDRQGNIKKKRKAGEPIIADGLHPAIVSIDVFEKCQKNKSSREQIRKELVNPFATLVVCGNCGYAVSMQNNPKCATRMVCSHQHQCHSQSILYETFLEEVIAALKNHIDDCEITVSTAPEQESTGVLAALKSDLKAIEKRQERLYKFLENGIYSEAVFIERNNALAQERKQLLTAIEKNKSSHKTAVEIKEYTSTLYKVIDSLKNESISAKSKNNLLKSIISRIEYTGKQTKGNKHKEGEYEIKIYF